MEIKKIVEESWDNREELASADIVELKVAINSIFEDLDSGRRRVAEKVSGQWQVNAWIKKAILLSFRVGENEISQLAYDKVPMKFSDWDSDRFKQSGIRAVPGNVVRYGAYVGPRVVLMPSFVNTGAFVDEGTMVDTWATVGSCAQIGRNCHLSGGVGIGGVLEPLQANPVIIEDNCFIGARSEVVEGMIVEEGAVIGMGVFLGASTPIVNRETGDITYGRIPSYSVVLSGTLPSKPLPDGRPGPHMPCAIIVKQVDAQTRSKTSLNDLLRPN
jgi:2,3,4,5-tetrahydropyridine-2,6-dicarboxylate N-succinyltransferase